MNRASLQHIAAWLFIGTGLLKMLYIDFTIVTILWLTSTLLLAIAWLSLDSLLLLLPYALVTIAAFAIPNPLPNSWPIIIRFLITIAYWGTLLLTLNVITFTILNKTQNNSRQRSKKN